MDNQHLFKDSGLLVRRDDQDCLEALKNAPMGIFTSTPEGRLLSANPAMARIFGYDSPQELIESITDIAQQMHVDPYDREEIKRILREKGEVLNYECRMLRKDGSIVWTSRNARAVCDDLGNVVHYQGFVTDITERKRAEQDLQERDVKLDSILTNLEDAIWSVGYPDIKSIFISPAVEKIYGLSVQMFFEDPFLWHKLVHPEDQQSLEETLFELTENGVLVRVCRIIRPDGKVRWISDRSRMVYDADNRPIRIDGIVRDITRLKQFELELEATRKDLSTILDTVPAMVWRKDRDGKYIHGNRLFCDTVGKELKDIQGKSDFDIHPQEIAVKYLNDDKQVLSSGQPVRNISEPHRKSTGQTGWSFTEKLPYYDQDGNITGTIGFALDITDLKSAEMELLLKDRAIESSINAVAMADLNGAVTYVNPAFLDLWGYQTISEVLGKPAVFFWESEDAPASVIETIYTQGSWQGEMTARRKDGELFSVELNAGLVVDRDGNPLCMQASFIEITERKMSEQRIRHLNAVLKAYNKVTRIIFHARDQKQMLQDVCQALVSTRGYYNAWIILLDSRHNVTDWGQAGLDDHFPALLAAFQEDNKPERALNVLSSPLMQVIRDPGNECSDCPLGESYAGRSGFSVRLEVEGFVLGLLTVSIPENLAVDSEEQELFTNLAGTIVQGVQRIRLEKIRRTQRERLKHYERIISRINDPMSLVGTDYRYIIVNDAYLRVFGKSREEIEGSTVEDLLGKDIFQNKVRHHLDKALSGEDVVFEDAFPDRDGSLKYRIMNYYSFHDKNGQVAGVVSTAKDITALKQTEEQLIRANQALQKSNSEKDRLFSYVAHDLKSPISGFVNLTQVLSEDIKAFSLQELEQMTREMHKSSESLHALLEDLLQWARMKQGLLVYTPESVCLNDIVTAGISVARNVADQKEVDLWDNIPKGMNLFADQKMIYSVIRNLIFNAIKFTHRGGNVSIHAHQQGSMVRVMVHDDGVGMDQDTLAGLFAMKQKKSVKGTEGEKGTGLGLALCKEFVEKHGGQIWIESRPGQGTTVYFTVPGSSEVDV
ncbi:PAS domain S-box protein [Desulfonatronospira sp.]|uniref:PAS domain S-box protein n=1 Tax=Desulfonatronospira sp. TaxID=1962951 RepID=UPI0025BCC599|nr:PAS domain S-box protein [Desulfonatronospira sp.]